MDTATGERRRKRRGESENRRRKDLCFRSSFSRSSCFFHDFSTYAVRDPLFKGNGRLLSLGTVREDLSRSEREREGRGKRQSAKEGGKSEGLSTRGQNRGSGLKSIFYETNSGSRLISRASLPPVTARSSPQIRVRITALLPYFPLLPLTLPLCACVCACD